MERPSEEEITEAADALGVPVESLRSVVDVWNEGDERPNFCGDPSHLEKMNEQHPASSEWNYCPYCGGGILLFAGG